MAVSKITVISIILSIISIVLLCVLLILVLILYLQLLRWDKSDQLLDIKNKLSAHHSNVLSTNWKRVNNHLSVVNTSNNLFQLPSCSEIKQRQPSSPSGYYLIKPSHNKLTSVYCNMDRTCGQITGGWMRVAKLDTDACPYGFETVLFNGAHKSCAMIGNNFGCTSIIYKTFNARYSHICGKVRGYVVGTLDGFRKGMERNAPTTSNIFDGVHITVGDDHVWLYAIAFLNKQYDAKCKCTYSPVYASDHFTCSHSTCDASQMFCDLVWAESDCGHRDPWFYVNFNNHTSMDIQVKVCKDETDSNEEIPIASLEIYIQ